MFSKVMMIPYRVKGMHVYYQGETNDGEYIIQGYYFDDSGPELHCGEAQTYCEEMFDEVIIYKRHKNIEIER